MAFNTDDLTQELIDEVWKLAELRTSQTNRLDISQLISTLIELKCSRLETSIPEKIPMPLFIQLVDIRLLYKLLGQDSVGLDRSLDRGLRNALEHMKSARREDPQLLSVEHDDLSDIFARLLVFRTHNPDDEWRSLVKMHRTTWEQLRRWAWMR